MRNTVTGVPFVKGDVPCSHRRAAASRNILPRFCRARELPQECRARRTIIASAAFTGHIGFRRNRVRPFVFVLAACAASFALAGIARGAPAPVPVASNAIRLSSARPIPTDIAAQPGPVRIDGCFSDGRGTDGLTLVHHALRVANTGDRPISAVRVRFAFYDAFGDVSAVRTNVAETRVEPGQTADRVNLAELSDAGPPARITCSIDAVRFADGTIARTGPPVR
jgi:hypothetical protein